MSMFMCVEARDKYQVSLFSHSYFLSQGVCVSYWSGCCDKLSDKSHLGKGALLLLTMQRHSSSWGGKSPWQKLETPGPIAWTTKKQGSMTMSSWLSPLYLVQDPNPSNGATTSKLALLTFIKVIQGYLADTNQICIIPHRHTQSIIFQVTLDPNKLTISVNCHDFSLNMALDVAKLGNQLLKSTCLHHGLQLWLQTFTAFS